MSGEQNVSKRFDFVVPTLVPTGFRVVNITWAEYRMLLHFYLEGFENENVELDW